MSRVTRVAPEGKRTYRLPTYCALSPPDIPLNPPWRASVRKRGFLAGSGIAGGPLHSPLPSGGRSPRSRGLRLLRWVGAGGRGGEKRLEGRGASGPKRRRVRKGAAFWRVCLVLIRTWAGRKVEDKEGKKEKNEETLIDTRSQVMRRT